MHHVNAHLRASTKESHFTTRQTRLPVLQTANLPLCLATFVLMKQTHDKVARVAGMEAVHALSVDFASV